MSANLLSSRCLSPDETRDLVVSLEHLGLETARIDVVADPAISTDETSSVDRRAVARPAQRVAIGLLAGIVVGLVLGAVAIVLSDALAAPTLSNSLMPDESMKVRPAKSTTSRSVPSKALSSRAPSSSQLSASISPSTVATTAVCS